MHMTMIMLFTIIGSLLYSKQEHDLILLYLETCPFFIELIPTRNILSQQIVFCYTR